MDMLQRLKNIFYRDLLDRSLKEEKGWKLFGLKALRVGALAVRGFFRDKCTLRASSLTYYSLMSIVPVVAMVLAIAAGFGFEGYLKQQLLERLPEQQVALTEIFAFSDRLLEQTKGGVLAAIGAIVLFWSVTQLLSSMESSLNYIWGVRKMRSWRRLFSDYFAVIFIAPIFFLLSSGAAVYLVHSAESLLDSIGLNSGISVWVLYVVKLIPYGFSSLLFSFIYLFLPNTHVRISAALAGGIFSGIAYLLVQWGYIYFQTQLSRYGAIYGSFAALPLFLIWVQINWFLLLLGAEISFASQTHEMCEFEHAKEHLSDRYKLLLSLWIVQIGVEGFLKGKPSIDIELLANAYKIPRSIASDLLEDLVRVNLLAPIASKELNRSYLLARDPHSLRLSDAMTALENGKVENLPLVDSAALRAIKKSLRSFSEAIEKNPDNLLFREIC